MANNWQRYWNDCSAIYSALVDVYNYEDDHIYTIMSDGTSTANDRRISGGYDSSPLDLDGDGDNDIQFSATRSNITTVFNTLSGLLDSDDYLFIFVTDHGDQESGQDALIYLWGETIRDDQFATEVNKVNAGEISIVMGQCYSGGFVDDLTSLNRVIATACDFDEPSCGMGYYTYDEFVFDWIAAVAGEDPNGNAVDADDNNDGFISMQEAFDYAETHDACSETPQYSSSPTDLGTKLAVEGSIIYITGPSYVCTSGTEFFIENADGDTIEWDQSSNIYRDSPQGSNPCTFSAVGYGNGWISATVNGVELPQIDVFSEYTNLSGRFMERGSILWRTLYTVNTISADEVTVEVSEPGVSSFDWSLEYSNGTVYWGTLSDGATMYFNLVTASDVHFEVSYEKGECGEVTK